MKPTFPLQKLQLAVMRRVIGRAAGLGDRAIEEAIHVGFILKNFGSSTSSLPG